MLGEESTAQLAKVPSLELVFKNQPLNRAPTKNLTIDFEKERPSDINASSSRPLESWRIHLNPLPFSLVRICILWSPSLEHS